MTGACIAVGFWEFFVGLGEVESSWRWAGGRDIVDSASAVGRDAWYWAGVGLLGCVSGLVSGVAEALGEFPF